jgi:hypothetical protein
MHPKNFYKRIPPSEKKLHDIQIQNQLEQNNLLTIPSKKQSEPLLNNYNTEITKTEAELLIDISRSAQKTAFTSHLVGTYILTYFSYVILISCMILSNSLYTWVYPQGFNWFITTVMKYKIFLFILAIIKITIALLLLFINIFTRVNAIFGVIIYIFYLISCCIFAAILALIPNYLVLFITIGIITILFVLIDITALLVVYVFNLNKSINKFGGLLQKGVSIFRVVLIILVIILLFNALPFDTFNPIPSWTVLIFIFILLLALHFVVMIELFDELTYRITNRSLLEMTFYLFTLRSEILLVTTVLIPTIGLRVGVSSVNTDIWNNLTTTQKNQLKTNDKIRTPDEEIFDKNVDVTKRLKNTIF